MTKYKGIEVEGFIFLENDSDNEVSILSINENYNMVAYVEDFGEISEGRCRVFLENWEG